MCCLSRFGAIRGFPRWWRIDNWLGLSRDICTTKSGLYYTVRISGERGVGWYSDNRFLVWVLRDIHAFHFETTLSIGCSFLRLVNIKRWIWPTWGITIIWQFKQYSLQSIWPTGCGFINLSLLVLVHPNIPNIFFKPCNYAPSDAETGIVLWRVRVVPRGSRAELGVYPYRYIDLGWVFTTFSE